MPSGGGSAGGGASGGGGGGGFSRHSFNSSRYFSRRSRSTTYTTSYSSGEDSKTGPCFGCCIICLIATFIVIVFGMVIGLSVGLNVSQSGKNSSDSSTIATDFYSPGDSRLLSLSSFFCDGGILELSSNNSIDAELFVIDSVPSLNDSNDFTVTIESTIDSFEYRFWQYYLYPNSNITASICTDLLANVYIVKGNDNANNWVNNPSQDVAEMFHYAPACCPNELEYSPLISFEVQEEDEYYIIIHNSLSTEISVNVTLKFERTEYSAPQFNTSESCTVTKQGQCTVGINYNTGLQNFLIKTSIPDNVNWEENVRVSLNCDQRGWAYAVATLVPLMVVIGIVVVLVLFVVCCCCECTKTESTDIETNNFNPDFPPSNSENVEKSDFDPDPPCEMTTI